MKRDVLLWVSLRGYGVNDSPLASGMQLRGPHHRQVGVQTEANVSMRLTRIGLQVCFLDFGEAMSVFSAAFASIGRAKTHRLHIFILFLLRLSSCQKTDALFP